MNKPKPLDLDVEKEVLAKFVYLFGYINEKNSPLLINELTQREYENYRWVIELTKEQIKQRIKQACKFYWRYKDNPELLIKEHPEYKKEMKKTFGRWDVNSDETRIVLTNKKYNEWLFKLAFRTTLNLE